MHVTFCGMYNKLLVWTDVWCLGKPLFHRAAPLSHENSHDIRVTRQMCIAKFEDIDVFTYDKQVRSRLPMHVTARPSLGNYCPSPVHFRFRPVGVA